MIVQSISPADEFEFCIVGTGPVGMALALELEQHGKKVLLVESGGIKPEPAIASASDAVLINEARHAKMQLVVCRALGGTSWTWGGRCVPLDDIDFENREYVPDATWPFPHDELKHWYGKASQYLNCDLPAYDLPDLSLTGGATAANLEGWCLQKQVIEVHRERLLASNNIAILLHTTVIGFECGADGGRVKSLLVQTSEGIKAIQTRQIILAMGGIETTRFLLTVQQKFPGLFGGLDGPLGRYYMGHISGKIANIVFQQPGFIASLDYSKYESGPFYRRRFMLNKSTQLRRRLLNTAFWPDNPPFQDPAHGSGVLSAVFLALAFPPTGRRLLPEGIRLAHTEPHPYRIAAHLKNTILGAPIGAVDIFRILRDRFLRKPRKPGFLVKSKSGRYALHYHAEQVPNPDSRITLSTECDQYGMPRARIDLRYTNQDIESVIASHNALDESLRKSGIAHLEYRYPLAELPQRVDAMAADGYHQVGTTRMGTDPSKSIVDSDLKVHGFDNLFVASSSVFVTTGQANSTLPAVALAMRLANHLVK